ncbi:MAG: YkvA family protein [Bacteroidota bacterium]
MNNEFDGTTFEEINSEEKVKEATEIVEEKLWIKLEKAGSKISFAKDLIALYKYLVDNAVSWHRKAIVVGALIYFIVPIDAIPDLAPLFGYMDDLGVIMATLKFLGSELIPYYD